MSAQEVLALAGRHGVSVELDGVDLRLVARAEPPAAVLDALRENKTAILQALSAPAVDTFAPVRDWLRGPPPEGIEDSPDWPEWRRLSSLVNVAARKVILMPDRERRAVVLFGRWVRGE